MIPAVVLAFGVGAIVDAFLRKARRGEEEAPSPPAPPARPTSPAQPPKPPAQSPPAPPPQGPPAAPPKPPAQAPGAPPAKSTAEDLKMELAKSVAADVRRKGKSYDRGLVVQFQRAVGLGADGLYGPQTAGAVAYYAKDVPPEPLFGSKTPTPYTPPKK